MSGWKLCFVLLLYLPVCFNSEVYEYKTIRRGPDVTPICTNTTEQVITLIVCKIRTYRTGGECRLLYRYGGDFEHECDSRFTLKMENHTAFLHLTGLTPVDSGNHTCQCGRGGETVTLHLNITVEDILEERFIFSSTFMAILCASIGVTVSLYGLIFGLICKRKLLGSNSAAPRSSVRETHDSVEDDPDDPYTSLQQPAADLYQTICHSRSSKDQEVDEEDAYEDMTP